MFMQFTHAAKTKFTVPSFVQLRHNTHGNQLPGWAEQVCNCSKNVRGITQCWTGRSAEIKAHYWAGNIGPSSLGQHFVSLSGVIYDKLQLATKESAVDGLDRFHPTTDVLGIAKCETCNCQKRVWRLDTNDSCSGHTSGVLCGNCQPGTFLKLAQDVRLTSAHISLPSCCCCSCKDTSPTL